MTTHTPNDVGRRLHALLRRGELDRAVLLYEEDAVFIEVDGVARGRSEIRAAHQAFVEAGLNVQLMDSTTFLVGDLALVHWSWVVEVGDGRHLTGVSSEVLRRQSDGRWLYVIDNSDGAAMLD